MFEPVLYNEEPQIHSINVFIKPELSEEPKLRIVGDSLIESNGDSITGALAAHAIENAYPDLLEGFLTLLPTGISLSFSLSTPLQHYSGKTLEMLLSLIEVQTNGDVLVLGPTPHLEEFLKHVEVSRTTESALTQRQLVLSIGRVDNNLIDDTIRINFVFDESESSTHFAVYIAIVASVLGGSFLLFQTKKGF